MKLGAVFPQTEVGSDPVIVREVEINQQLMGRSPEAVAIGKRLAAVVAPIAAAARTAENEQGAA